MGGGGDKNPPTARATRMQGADGGDGASRGGQRMAEPTVTMETAEGDGSAEPQQEQSGGVDGTRSEHSASEDDGHGASANRKGTGKEEERDKTPQRTLPVREHYRSHTECP